MEKGERVIYKRSGRGNIDRRRRGMYTRSDRGNT